MMPKVKHSVKNLFRRLLLVLPNRMGIKILLRMEASLYAFVVSVIKSNEQSSGGIHPKHRVTDFHDFFLDNIRPTDKVIDIGCAYGHIANVVAQKAQSVLGIDVRSEPIKSATRQFNRKNLSFKVGDFTTVKWDEKFDVAILSNIIEHIDDRSGFVRNAFKIADKLLIRVPAADRDWMVAYRKELGLEWRLHKDHRLEYTDDILKKELLEADLVAEHMFCKWGNYCCVVKTQDKKE